ncbi:YwqG family protein [Nocardiopsis sediminis]|uniref:YwqG family protein n=1 Tax=Nocardiopsis sediminis TaxID=1778267 RepID=A0ABV8FKX3_9ACTN
MDESEILPHIDRHCAEVMGEVGGRAMAALVRRGHTIAPVGGSDLPAGRSHLGGSPQLEPGTPWPEIDGVPLSLLAVLDTDALAPWLGDDLPVRLGLLNFFYLDPDLPWPEYKHVDYEDPSAWRVIAADPERTVSPLAPEAARVYERRAVKADPILTLPGNWEHAVNALDLGSGKVPALEAMGIRTAWGPFAPEDDKTGGHRAFGWPWLLQGGVMSEDDVLLLQLDSDDHWMWGDVGVLYFTIPADALRTGDFSRVVCRMDCC